MLCGLMLQLFFKGILSSAFYKYKKLMAFGGTSVLSFLLP